MSQSEFDLPDQLTRALVGDITEMLEAAWGVRFPFVDDFESVPKATRFIGVGKAPTNVERLRHADQIVAIRTSSTTPEIVNELSYLPELRLAFLITLKLGDSDLFPLAGCRKLEHLALFDAPTLTDLGFLAGLTRLRALHLHAIPRLDFASLPPVPSLQKFVFDGGFHQGVKVPSLAPLARLKGLRSLELRNVAALDGSLAPLAILQDLEILFVPGKAYEVEEYARLAASLPNTRGTCVDCLNPILTKPRFCAPGEAHFPCPKCAQPRVLLTGKGTRMSCLICDAKRIEKHIARWDAALRPFP